MFSMPYPSLVDEIEVMWVYALKSEIDDLVMIF